MKLVYEYFNDRYEKSTDVICDIITTYHAILHLEETQSRIMLWIKESNVLIKLYDLAEEINAKNALYGEKTFDLVKETIQKR